MQRQKKVLLSIAASLTAGAIAGCSGGGGGGGVVFPGGPVLSNVIVFETGLREEFQNTVPASRSEIFTIRPDGTGKTQLTNSPGYDGMANLRPDGKAIVFVSNRDGNDELYLMSSDGSQLKRLTNNPANDRYPCFSPDGQSIAFSSDRDGDEEIYVLRADGTDAANLKRLTNNSQLDRDPVFSPDGTQIAFVGQRPNNNSSGNSATLRIYLMNAADGTNERLLATSFDGGDHEPDWSPDGRRIMFARRDTSEFSLGRPRAAVGPRVVATPTQNGVFFVETNESDWDRLNSGQLWQPVFSPTGNRVCYANQGSLTLQKSDGSRSERVVDSQTGASVLGFPSDWR